MTVCRQGLWRIGSVREKNDSGRKRVEGEVDEVSRSEREAWWKSRELTEGPPKHDGLSRRVSAKNSRA
jgi:hypothetical protein